MQSSSCTQITVFFVCVAITVKLLLCLLIIVGFQWECAMTHTCSRLWGSGHKDGVQSHMKWDIWSL